MKKLLVALLVLLVLGGGGFAAWWFYFKPEPQLETTDDLDAEVTANTADTFTSDTNSNPTQTDSSEPSRTSSGRAKSGDMARLTIPDFAPWKGSYDRFLHSWTFVHPGKDADGISRFYIGRMPETAPKDLHGYAEQLRKDPTFQDIGYIYDEIDDTEIYQDGWLIQGKVKDTRRPDEATILSFVLHRTVLGVHIRCRGSSFQNAKARQLAIDGCRRATFQ